MSKTGTVLDPRDHYEQESQAQNHGALCTGCKIGTGVHALCRWSLLLRGDCYSIYTLHIEGKEISRRMVRALPVVTTNPLAHHGYFGANSPIAA